MTAPGSPWMTMYLVAPRYNPVGASVPGFSKSFMIPVISSGLNYMTESIKKDRKDFSASINRSQYASHKE